MVTCLVHGSKDDEKIFVNGFTSSTTVPLDSDDHITADSVRTERRMRVLHDAIEVLVGPLQEGELIRLVLKTRDLVEFNCVPLLILYCCDIVEGKDRLAEQHGVMAQRPCLEDIMTVDHIFSFQMAAERSLRGTKMARKSF